MDQLNQEHLKIYVKHFGHKLFMFVGICLAITTIVFLTAALGLISPISFLISGRDDSCQFNNYITNFGDCIAGVLLYI